GQLRVAERVRRLGEDRDDDRDRGVGADAPRQLPGERPVVARSRDVGPHREPHPPAAPPGEADDHHGVRGMEAEQVRNPGREHARAKRSRGSVDSAGPCGRAGSVAAAARTQNDYWTQNEYWTALRAASQGRTCSASTARWIGSWAYR